VRQNAWAPRNPAPDAEAAASVSQLERPRLQLAPRTLPVVGEAAAAAVAAAAGGSAIFGAAKPVDTAARELEIERRLKEERARQQQGARASEEGQQL